MKIQRAHHHTIPSLFLLLTIQANTTRQVDPSPSAQRLNIYFNGEHLLRPYFILHPPQCNTIVESESHPNPKPPFCHGMDQDLKVWSCHVSLAFALPFVREPNPILPVSLPTVELWLLLRKHLFHGTYVHTAQQRFESNPNPAPNRLFT